jgi:hypothetical protein
VLPAFVKCLNGTEPHLSSFLNILSMIDFDCGRKVDYLRQKLYGPQSLTILLYGPLTKWFASPNVG